MLEVRYLDNLGVPGYWVPTDGPSAGGIVFRAGRGSEPAALSGITHLIKHLTMESIGYMAHGPFDPFDSDIEGFSCEGSPEQLSAFLSELSLRLSVIPVTELEHGKSTLKNESNGWVMGPKEHLQRTRYGLNGLGSNSLEEYGTRKAGHLQINNWASRYFHNGNVVVWMSGQPIPEPRMRFVRGVPPSSYLQILDVPTPGAIYGQENQVAISMLAASGYETEAWARICLLYTSPSPRDGLLSRMPSSA